MSELLSNRKEAICVFLACIALVGATSACVFALQPRRELSVIIPNVYLDNWRVCQDRVNRDLAIRIYLEPVGSDLSSVLSVRFAAGNPSDMAMVPADYVEEYVEYGFLRRLDKYANQVLLPYIVEIEGDPIENIPDTKSIAGVLLPWAPGWVVVFFRAESVELGIEALNNPCFQLGLPPSQPSTTMFVDSAGNEVSNYTDADRVYVKVVNPSHAGAPPLSGLEIEGLMFDLIALAGPTRDTFITGAISMAVLGVGPGDSLTATYVDPTDQTEASSDTIRIIASTPPRPQEFTFRGRVFEGEKGDVSQPLGGVTVALYGANDRYSDEGQFIIRAITDQNGWYNLSATEGYEYYSIREIDPHGFKSVDARTVDGLVQTKNWIEFVVPLEDKNLTGNMFWDKEQKPDLVVREIRFDPQEPDVEHTVRFLAEIVNVGNTSAGQATVLFRVGTEELDPQRVGPLEAGSAETVEASWHRTRPGKQEVYVVVDVNREIPELDEKNNVGHREFSVHAPDLVVDQVWTDPKEPLAEEEVRLFAKIVNTGSLASKQIGVVLKIDRQEVYRDVLDLESGKEETVEASWQAPYPGSYTLSVKVDFGDEILESDEENNSKDRKISVPGPDLTVIRTTPQFPDPDRLLIITATIENIGRGWAPETKIKTVEHSRELLSVLLGRHSGWQSGAVDVPKLDPGDKTEVDIDLGDIRYEHRDFWHVFRVQLESVEYDSNRANDHRDTDPIFIPHLPPDLAVSDPTVEIIEDNRALLITATVTNEGEGPAQSTHIRAFEEETNWESDDHTVSELEPKGRDSVKIRLGVPDGKRGSEHVFIVELDPVTGDANPDNDRIVTPRIDIPPLPPDLAIVDTTSKLTENNRVLIISANVKNTGGTQSPMTTIGTVEHSPGLLSLILGRRTGWTTEGSLVRGLDPGEETPVEIELVIPSEQRGFEHVFRLKLVSVEGDSNPANDQLDTEPIYIPLQPDLAVIDASAELTENNRAVLITATAKNLGEERASGTTAHASSEKGNWAAGESSVSSLAPGEEALIVIHLDVPDEQRGSEHMFAVRLDPVEDDFEAANDLSNTAPIYVPLPPDLAVIDAYAELIEDNSVVLITATVKNLGEERASGTTVHVSSEEGDWAVGESSVSSLAPKEETPVEMRFDVPDEQRGSEHVFAVRLDPVEDDFEEANDVSGTAPIYVPLPPDLAVTDVSAKLIENNRAVLITATVKNLGEEQASGTSVHASSEAGAWAAGESSVSSLAPGEETLVGIRLDVPDEQRGERCVFAVRLRRIANDHNPDNDETSIEISIPSKPIFPPWVWGLLGGAGAAALSGGTLCIRRSIKTQHHRKCQERAKEEELPETCRAGARYCRLTELKVDSTPWKVDKLIVVAKGAEPSRGSGDKKQFKGSIKKGLNEAIDVARKGATSEKLHGRLNAVARILSRRIVKWLHAEGGIRDVSIEGHLVDGQVESEYKLYECQQAGNTSSWQEIDKWTAKIKAERDEHVAELQGIDITKSGVAEQLEPELAQALVSFVQRVSSLPVRMRDARVELDR